MGNNEEENEENNNRDENEENNEDNENNENENDENNEEDNEENNNRDENEENNEDNENSENDSAVTIMMTTAIMVTSRRMKTMTEMTLTMRARTVHAGDVTYMMKMTVGFVH